MLQMLLLDAQGASRDAGVLVKGRSAHALLLLELRLLPLQLFLQSADLVLVVLLKVCDSSLPLLPLAYQGTPLRLLLLLAHAGERRVLPHQQGVLRFALGKLQLLLLKLLVLAGGRPPDSDGLRRRDCPQVARPSGVRRRHRCAPGDAVLVLTAASCHPHHLVGEPTHKVIALLVAAPPAGLVLLEHPDDVADAQCEHVLLALPEGLELFDDLGANGIADVMVVATPTGETRVLGCRHHRLPKPRAKS
mmetsp:Transcript_85343/g.246716  ORF Transcript_85343/g.246716 Transcript_85343/m.246716 type:complete len:248 (-) Transcript_85343:39-782(-)